MSVSGKEVGIPSAQVQCLLEKRLDFGEIVRRAAAIQALYEAARCPATSAMKSVGTRIARS